MTNSSPPVSPELDALPRWVPPVVFALLTAVVFRAYLLSAPGQMLLGQDTLAAGIMFRSFFVDQFHKLGRLPLWNPYLFGGVPTIEGGSGDILYPGAWLHFILPLTAALAWKLIVHVFLAGVFMYCAARAFGVSRWVALFAGAAYLLGPNLVSLVWGGQDGKMYVITLFPAALWLLVTGLRTGSLLRFLWLGVVAGLMLLAHPQPAFYAYIALGGYAIGSIIVRRREGQGLLLRRLAGGVAALVVALSIGAVELLPMHRYLREDSPRSGAGKGFEWAASYSLHPEEVVNFVVPDFSGVDDTYWGRNPLKHNSEYGGVVVLALGIAGILALKGDRRRWGLLGMAVVALLYALGTTTPFFQLLFLTIPGLKNFRAPSLSTFVALSAITILAALLLERVFRDRRSPEGATALKVLGVIGVLALLIGIVMQGGGGLRFWFGIFGDSPRAQLLDANRPAMVTGSILTAVWCGLAAGILLLWRHGIVGARVALGGLLLVSAIDLLRVDARYIEVVRYADYFPDDQGIQTLKQALGPGERVFTYGRVFPTEGHLAVYGIPLVFGYHGNELRWFDDFTRNAIRQGGGSDEAFRRYFQDLLTGPVLRLLATRIVILPGQFKIPGYESLGGNDQVGIYRNPRALRGATVVPHVTVEPDSTRLLNRLWDSTFTPEMEALTFTPVPSLAQGGGKGDATIDLDAADSVALHVTVDGPAMLLVSRNWHPSWRATVDGTPIEVVRTDYSLIGIPLGSAGPHSVTLAYRPSLVATARRISLAGWGAVLLLSLLSVGAGFRRETRRA